jgi:hypothetical protein
MGWAYCIGRNRDCWLYSDIHPKYGLDSGFLACQRPLHCAIKPIAIGERHYLLTEFSRTVH